MLTVSYDSVRSYEGQNLVYERTDGFLFFCEGRGEFQFRGRTRFFLVIIVSLLLPEPDCHTLH